MCNEAAKIARGDEAILKIGYLRSHNSPEVHQALEEFSEKYPRVDLQLLYGNHEDLFDLLRTGGADLVLNDQRRAFSDEYVNLILATNKMYIELAARNPVAELSSVTVQELKNIPCILVASKEQQATEKEFYQTIIGIQSEILYAENLEEARMKVISGQGFLPVEGSGRLWPLALLFAAFPYVAERSRLPATTVCSGKRTTLVIMWRSLRIF